MSLRSTNCETTRLLCVLGPDMASPHLDIAVEGYRNVGGYPYDLGRRVWSKLTAVRRRFGSSSRRESERYQASRGQARS
jgi:hypothetical protein